RLTIRQQELERQGRHVDGAVEIAEVVLRLQIGERTDSGREWTGGVAEQRLEASAVGVDRFSVDLVDVADAEPGVGAGEVSHDYVLRLEDPLLSKRPLP